MKFIHICGLAGTLFVVGVMLFIMWNTLWYVGLACEVGGAMAVAIGLARLAAPAYVQITGERHKQAMEVIASQQRERVLALAERPGYRASFSTNGTIEVSPVEYSVPRVEAPRQPALPAPVHVSRPLSPEVRYEDCLNLSPHFQPHADSILSQRGMVVGISGSGKSNTIATIHEELGRLEVPFILIDTEGEYSSLCDARYLPYGRLAGANGSLSINQSNAREFGHYALDNNLQVVLDVSSYTADEAAMVVVNLIAGLQEWEEALPNAERVSCMVSLSEARFWFPQNSKVVRFSKSVFDTLQSTFFDDLVPRGRKRGLGFLFDIQKIAEVDKRLMQTGWKVLHRQTEKNDLDLYQGMGIEASETLDLADGEAFVFTSQVSKKRVQIRKRLSRHEADTPGLASVRNRQRNFDESSEISFASRNRFDAPTESFRIVSGGFDGSTENPKMGVPENTKYDITRLYQAGKKRTEIQQILGLNGDEYWMIRDVCNALDRQERGA